MQGRTPSVRQNSGDITRKNSGSWFKKAFGSNNSKRPLDSSVTAVDVASSNTYQPYQQPHPVATEIPAATADKSFGTPKVRVSTFRTFSTSSKSLSSFQLAIIRCPVVVKGLRSLSAPELPSGSAYPARADIQSCFYCATG